MVGAFSFHAMRSPCITFLYRDNPPLRGGLSHCRKEKPQHKYSPRMQGDLIARKEKPLHLPQHPFFYHSIPPNKIPVGDKPCGGEDVYPLRVFYWVVGYESLYDDAGKPFP
jgi:hypothetical protein